MNGHLIVVTGAHGCAREALETFISSRDDTTYFACLEESLRTEFSQVELDEALMQKELERDTIEILPLLASGGTAVVEQWHIGNLARVRVNAPALALHYEERLIKHISSLQDVSLDVLYVSTDPGKTAHQPETDNRQNELVYVLRDLLNLQEHPIDGEAPPHYIQSRVNYLLGQILG